MTPDQKLTFALSHTIQVAGQLYAVAMGEDGLRKTEIRDCQNMRTECIRHAIALVGQVLDMTPTVKRHIDTEETA